VPSSYDVDPSSLGRLTCASLTVEDEGKRVELNGWVNRRRDLGGLIFIDLRDRFGITQIIFNPEIAPAAHEIASGVRNEYVLKITGIVRRRSPDTINPRLPTGTIEVEAHEIEILNASLTPPFYIVRAGSSSRCSRSWSSRW
jgi:aspartyl-tRNA synthetase